MPNVKPLTLALVASLVIGLTTHDTAAQNEKSQESGPPPEVTSCSDFYTFTNQQWLQTNAPDPATGRISALGELQARAQAQQRELLNAVMNTPQSNIQTLLGDFWASGLNEAAVEADGATPIAPLLERINGIRRSKDIPPAIAALHQVGIPVAFGFNADVDLGDLGGYIGYFTQGGTGLPDPAYYTRTDADTAALLTRYTEYVQQILTLTGTPADKVAEQAQQVIDLETRIAQVSRPIAALRDPLQNYALVSTADLGKTYKHLQLSEFLQAQGVVQEFVSMANPQQFALLDTLVDTLKPEQWKTYLRFQVGDAMAPYLAKSFRDAEFEFRGRVLRGEQTPPERSALVLQAINRAAGPMMAREYVGRYLPTVNRDRAERIAGEVRDALGRALDANQWMSGSARTEAKAKVAALKIEVGAPERDIDYTVQPAGRGSFGANMLIASTWHHREEMRRIGRQNASRRWDVLPQEPAVAYDIAQNRLIISAAAVQPPLLDMTRDAAAHYGAFGALVGHELSHAVDIKGRVVDASRTVRTWWTPQDDAAWQDRGNRLSAQYSAYDVPNAPELKVNGLQTRAENAADLAGVELAWSALNQSKPDLSDDGRKAFFQGWAELWRQQRSAKVATADNAVPAHAPGKWRSNGVLVNVPAFGETYKCKQDSAMTRAQEEQVAIWR